MTRVTWRTALGAMILTGLLTGCGGPPLPPAPLLYTEGLRPKPFADTPACYQNNLAPIVYVTDRVSGDTHEKKVAYSWRRAHRLEFGLCTVRIGSEETTWEELRDASVTGKHKGSLDMKVIGVEPKGQTPNTPVPVKLVDGKRTRNTEHAAAMDAAMDKLAALIDERLAMSNRKDLYVFIHGFNNTFDEGAFRAAALWHYMGREGVGMLYSWPAGSGSMRSYNIDRESGEFTIGHLKHALMALRRCKNLRNIHLIAHSRGTDVLTAALRELGERALGAGKDPVETVPIKTLVLAAPDLDLTVAVERVFGERIHLFAQQFAMYSSPYDKAVQLSDWLFGGTERLGMVAWKDLPEVVRSRMKELPGVQFINVRERTGFLGHSYFIDNPAVFSDLISLMRYDEKPGAPARPLIKDGKMFWTLKAPYPQPREK